MKRYLILMLLIIQQSVYGQRILFKENYTGNSGNVEVFGKYSLGAVQRSNCPMDFIKDTAYPTLTKWASSPTGDIYWTNGAAVYKYDFDRQQSSLLEDKIYNISEMVVSDRYVYVVSLNEKLNANNGSRYAAGQKVYRISIANGKKETVPIPDGLNFTNLSVSDDGNTLSFIHTFNYDDQSLCEFRLCTFDVIAKRLNIIDKGQKRNDEYFGSPEKYNSLVWMDSNKMLYFKHEKGKIGGSIFVYDKIHGVKNIMFNNVLDKTFTWFSFYDQWFLFSDGEHIYKTRDGINKEIVLDKNIQQAVLVQR
ncbi:hypothetical protein C3K47_03605 [Solitalea longa]|uniref:Dipeptidylpeptidase IV N-terminal domain-containing protein n=1 Tax=Solitalea longa TaxID=2079460 RepID=A0A2S5A816_9SPHI|nr:hypothetical protein [Solitalea longa]POY38492.1 hypothetical protein C3K47_03605 [Solitalea longa]